LKDGVSRLTKNNYSVQNLIMIIRDIAIELDESIIVRTKDGHKIRVEIREGELIVTNNSKGATDEFIYFFKNGDWQESNKNWASEQGR
jgi:hypothetical protein